MADLHPHVPEEDPVKLRALLKRAYIASQKPHWAEGECFNEVSLDIIFSLSSEDAEDIYDALESWNV